MAEPRLNYSGTRENPFAFQYRAPQLLESSTIKVYDNYKIYHFPEGIHLDPEEIIKAYNPYFPWQFERVDYKVSLKTDGTLPPGEYIRHSGEVKREYSPLKDEQLLLFEFRKLGRKPEVDKDAILAFVRKYGHLKEAETLYPAVNVPYYNYSLVAFHLYAREAYFITSLYQELYNLDHDKAAILLSDFFDVEEFSMTYDELGNWRQLLDEIYDSLPKDCREAVRDEYENQDDAELPFLTIKERKELTNIAAEEQPDPEAFITDPDEIRQLKIMAMLDMPEPRKFVYKLEGLSAEVWKKILSKAPHSFILGLAANVIATITNLRVSAEGSFYATPIIPDKADGRYQFKGTWDGPSLLTSMWLVFYLRITNQLNVKYRICLSCDKIIENPRSNQKFCSDKTLKDNKCKSRYHMNLRRKVQSLRTQGYSKDDILRETDATLDQIEKYTRK